MHMFVFFVIIYGALVGSFINAVLDRLVTGESISANRSHCDSCGHTLGVMDLIPVLSWIFLGGTCRYCGAHIPSRNIIVELTTICLFILTYYTFGTNFTDNIELGALLIFILLLTVVSTLLVLFFYDMKHQILPDRVMIVLLLTVLSLQFVALIVEGSFLFNASLENIVLSSIGSALPYFLIIVLTKGAGMGGGDLKLAFIMGALLGYPRILLAQYLAFLIGGIVAIFLLLGGKKKFGQTVAFGPFMILGTYIAIFWGEMLITVFRNWIP